MGAQSGIQECKHQFGWDRWNCPESALQLSTHTGLRSGKIMRPIQFFLNKYNDETVDRIGLVFLRTGYAHGMRIFLVVLQS